MLVARMGRHAHRVLLALIGDARERIVLVSPYVTLAADDRLCAEGRMSVDLSKSGAAS